MQGRVIAEDWQKILYVGYDRATRGRTDGALVRFTMPFGARRRARPPRASCSATSRASVAPLLPRFVPS